MPDTYQVWNGNFPPPPTTFKPVDWPYQFVAIVSGTTYVYISKGPWKKNADGTYLIHTHATSAYRYTLTNFAWASGVNITNGSITNAMPISGNIQEANNNIYENDGTTIYYVKNAPDQLDPNRLNLFDGSNTEYDGMIEVYPIFGGLIYYDEPISFMNGLVTGLKVKSDMTV